MYIWGWTAICEVKHSDLGLLDIARKIQFFYTLQLKRAQICLHFFSNNEGAALSKDVAASANDDYRDDEADGNSSQHSDKYCHDHDHATAGGGFWLIAVLFSCGEKSRGCFFFNFWT